MRGREFMRQERRDSGYTDIGWMIRESKAVPILVMLRLYKTFGCSK
jgi:hypothetical protein